MVPGQAEILAIETAAGVGLIVTVNDIGSPWQPFREGITVMVLEMSCPVLFEGAFQDAMVVVFPELAIPIAVFEFVHVKLAPVGVLVKEPISINCPGQTIMFCFCIATGVGNTVTVNVVEPGHPLKAALTENEPDIDALVVFVAVHVGILPLPKVPNPIAELEFVQLKLAPGGVLVNDEIVIGKPGQVGETEIELIPGVGLTVTEKDMALPRQLFKEGVT